VPALSAAACVAAVLERGTAEDKTDTTPETGTAMPPKRLAGFAVAVKTVCARLVREANSDTDDTLRIPPATEDRAIETGEIEADGTDAGGTDAIGIETTEIDVSEFAAEMGRLDETPPRIGCTTPPSPANAAALLTASGWDDDRIDGIAACEDGTVSTAVKLGRVVEPLSTKLRTDTRLVSGEFAAILEAAALAEEDSTGGTAIDERSGIVAEVDSIGNDADESAGSVADADRTGEDTLPILDSTGRDTLPILDSTRRLLGSGSTEEDTPDGIAFDRPDGTSPDRASDGVVRDDRAAGMGVMIVPTLTSDATEDKPDGVKMG
jgi:hypothetical protein